MIPLTVLTGLLLIFSPVAPKSFQKLEELLKSNLLKSVSHFGEPCSTTEQCATHSGLTCRNSTCLCTSPDYIARLSPEKVGGSSECVLRAGAKCVASELPSLLQRSNDERTLSAAYFWNKLRKNVPFLTEIGSGVSLDFFDSSSNCVDNARCTAGVCHCSPDHFQDTRGLCLRKRTVFQSCEHDTQCRDKEGLTCHHDGQCKCANGRVFSSVQRKCLIPVNGECDAYSSSTILEECVPHADCSNGRCLCLPGYKMNSDGSCGRAHGGLCDMEANICSDIQLVCRSGSCQCRYSVHQVYNETVDECLSKPDGPCIPITTGLSLGFQQNCVPFAECVKAETAAVFEHVCRCQTGFAEDSSGNCVPSYGTNCIEDEDCDQAIGQLVCMNGRCGCPDEMLTWDEKRRKCVGMVGARCRFIQLERFLSLRVDVPTECVENGVCLEHVSRLDGRCECKEGYVFSKAQLKCVAL